MPKTSKAVEKGVKENNNSIKRNPLDTRGKVGKLGGKYQRTVHWCSRDELSTIIRN